MGIASLSSTNFLKCVLRQERWTCTNRTVLSTGLRGTDAASLLPFLAACFSLPPSHSRNRDQTNSRNTTPCTDVSDEPACSVTPTFHCFMMRCVVTFSFVEICSGQMPGALSRHWNNPKFVACKLGFYTLKHFSENYSQFRHARSKSSPTFFQAEKTLQ